MMARNQQAGLKEAMLAQQRAMQQRDLEAKEERQQTQITATKEQRERDNMFKGAMAAMAQSNRAATAAAKPAPPEFKEADIQKLGQFADKKQLPRLLIQGRQLLDQFKQFGDKTPGFGADEQMLQRAPFGVGSSQLSPEAIDNMAAITGIYNGMTRADAGLSQTLSEVQRQALETFNSPLTSAKVRIQVFKKHILPVLEQSRSATLGTASPAALAEYRARQEAIGGNAQWMDALDFGDKPTAQPAAAPAGGRKALSENELPEFLRGKVPPGFKAYIE
jgi:hypothetical protein